MEELKKITASPELCDALVVAGIHVPGIFSHILGPFGEDEEEEWTIEYHVTTTLPHVPAWTMEELHVMIGGDLEKPDIQASNRITSSDIPIDKTIFTYKPDYWMIHLPEKGMKIKKGSDAAAAYLLEALKRGFVKAHDCNERYKLFYLTETT